MPPPSEAVYEREAEELLEDVEVFVDDEPEQRVEPIGFEVAFGMEPGSEEPLSDDRPLDARPRREGACCACAGRIDRIDRLERGARVPGRRLQDRAVLRQDDYEGMFVQGTRLQPMVYGLAAEQLLAAQATRTPA